MKKKAINYYVTHHKIKSVVSVLEMWLEDNIWWGYDELETFTGLPKMMLKKILQFLTKNHITIYCYLTTEEGMFQGMGYVLDNFRNDYKSNLEEIYDLIAVYDFESAVDLLEEK